MDEADARSTLTAARWPTGHSDTGRHVIPTPCSSCVDGHEKVSMPAAAAGVEVTIYAVAGPGRPYPEQDCTLATSTREYARFKVSIVGFILRRH